MQNIKPTDLADQEHYIRHCKKPFKYNCHELSSRLQFHEQDDELIPGSQRYTSLHPPRPQEHLLQNDARQMATCINQQWTRYC